MKKPSITKIKKGDIVICPQVEGLLYLTPGKEYEVIDADDNSLFQIITDFDSVAYCVLKKCCHLEMNDWILKKKKNKKEN